MSTETLRKTIGKNLKEARLDKRLTQEQVAELVGTTVNYYAKLERGKSMPSIPMLEKLVKTLGVNSCDITEF